MRFIYIVTCNYFIFMAKQYSIVGIYYNFFTYSSINAHLGHVHLLSIVNRAAMYMHGMYLCQYLFIYLFFKILFIYLFLAVLGLRFCARAFSSCSEWGPLFIAVRGPLTVAAPLVEEHRLQMRRLSSCGSWAQLLRGMWDPPSPGLEPVSPALAGRFSTTVPPGKPSVLIFIFIL